MTRRRLLFLLLAVGAVGLAAQFAAWTAEAQFAAQDDAALVQESGRMFAEPDYHVPDAASHDDFDAHHADGGYVGGGAIPLLMPDGEVAEAEDVGGTGAIAPSGAVEFDAGEEVIELPDDAAAAGEAGSMVGEQGLEGDVISSPDDVASPVALEVSGVLLRVLNKITAKSQSFEATLGASHQLDGLELKVEDCWQAPISRRPENAARVQIWEHRPNEGRLRIFYGWMFSSSPSLSAMEHPVYDITVVECLRTPVTAVKP